MSNYFDVKDILATQERLSCVFEIDIPKMGYLDSSSQDTNLKSNAKLDLPYWLVKEIYNHKFKFVRIETPKPYKMFFNEILRADPCVVDLRKMNQFYYDFGVHLINLFNDENGRSIGPILLWCFRNRFRRIMDLSSQTDHTGLMSDINKFDNTEAEMYRAGQSDLVSFIKWQQRDCRLLPSFIISASRYKRKRNDSDAENHPI